MSTLRHGCRLSDSRWHITTSETKIDSWYSAGPRDSFGFAARRSARKKRKASVSYTTGAMIEPQSLLGSTSHGAFGTMSAGTFLTGIEAERPCGTWSCKAAGSLGVSLMRPEGGLIQSSTPTLASSFSVQALKETSEYDVYVELSQPLRVESGSVDIAYPSARTPDRKILNESFRASLSPDGRQIDLQAGVFCLSPGTRSWERRPGFRTILVIFVTHPQFSALRSRIEAIFRDKAKNHPQIQRRAILTRNLTHDIPGTQTRLESLHTASAASYHSE